MPTTLTTNHKNLQWTEIQKHNNEDDCWLVVEGKVYKVTRWAESHPGGRRILSYHAGRDATEFFNAFHKDKSYVRKFLKALYLGDVEGYTRSNMFDDFTVLTEKANEMGLFTPRFSFYALMLLHVFLLEILAYLVVLVFGTGWLPFSFSVLLQSIYIMQGSWLQHDYGHGSPCKSRFWQKVFHYITGSLIMITKDPDLNLGPFYVQGDVMAREAAESWKNPLPFHKQHIYFFALGPPILLSVLMQLSCCVFMVANKCWLDIVLGSLCFLRYYYLYEPLLGFRWMLIMFACMRCIQSHWFTFVALANHVPMPISHDEMRSWFQHQVESTVNIEPSIFNHWFTGGLNSHVEHQCLQSHWFTLVGLSNHVPKPINHKETRVWFEHQVVATCNIEQSMFNHWFTGGLNTHIEHHLFPTMPRHNLHKITPYVKALCDKNNIVYTEKSLSKAMMDIIWSLKSYGEVWKKAKMELHTD